MDNNNNRRLSEENQKWLDDLLNAPDSQEVGAGELARQFAKPEEETKRTSPDEQAILEAEALVADQEPVADVGDAELEEILSENWLGDTSADTQDEDSVSVVADTEEAATENTEDSQFPETEDATGQPPRRRFRKIFEQKGRPQRTDGYGLLGIPHILSTFIWLALILAIGISLGRVLWVCCADMMAFGKEPQTVTITITEKDTAASIAQKLSDASLVRYPKLFEMFINVTGKEDDIGVGTFTLNSQLDYNAMVNAMYSSIGRREVVDIMFPEGYNCAQIFKLLEEKKVCSAAELEDYAANGELKEYWFLEGVARDDKYCLEGYLAPDTYQFYTGDDPQRVIEKFLDEFDSRFTEKMKNDFKTMQAEYARRLKAGGFSSDYVQKNTLTLHQVVTLASIIQKEAASTDEGFKIAAVFYARLCDRKIMSLGADASVHYALGDYFFEIKELTKEHLEFDSPYNTRHSQGIPPGPICNMGVQALYAALEPDSSYYQYRYFVYDSKNKMHIFSKTEAEHERNKKALGYS